MFGFWNKKTRQIVRKLEILRKNLAFFCVLTEYLSCLPTDLDKTNAIESEIECRLQINHISKYRHLS